MVTDSNLKLFTTIQFHVIGLNERAVVALHRDDVSISTRNYIQRRNVCLGGNTSRARVIGDRFEGGITASARNADTVSAKPSYNARNLSRSTASIGILLLFPAFGIVIYALNFKLSCASMMKSACHFDRSLDPMANKPRRNVLFASCVAETCRNL